MVDGSRRRLLLSLPALAWWGLPPLASARPETLRFAMSGRSFDVMAFRAAAPAPRPAVLVMGGTKGYASPAYGLLAAALDRAGIDTVLIGYLSHDDENAMRDAASAQARIAFYAGRMADWANTIPVTIATLRRLLHPPSRFGVLGLSLGAMPALTAGANGGDVSALAIVDGSLPADALAAVRSFPPMLAIWGGSDGVFPPATGAKLAGLARRLGGSSRLVTYAGRGHAFFVDGDNPDAARARATVAEFFAARL